MEAADKDKYTVEWSQNQKCFHIDTLANTLKRNVLAYRIDRKTEYILLAIVNSREEATIFCDTLEKERPLRDDGFDVG